MNETRTNNTQGRPKETLEGGVLKKNINKSYLFPVIGDISTPTHSTRDGHVPIY